MRGMPEIDGGSIEGSDLHLISNNSSIKTEAKKGQNTKTVAPMITKIGHNKIHNPANGTQTVSKKGPSLPIRYCISRYHPLNRRIGVLYRTIAGIRIASTNNQRAADRRQTGIH